MELPADCPIATSETRNQKPNHPGCRLSGGFAVQFEGCESRRCRDALQSFLGLAPREPVLLPDTTALAAGVCWLLVNRPAQLKCTITGPWDGASSCLQFIPPPALVPVPVGNGSSMCHQPDQVLLISAAALTRRAAVRRSCPPALPLLRPNRAQGYGPAAVHDQRHPRPRAAPSRVAPEERSTPRAGRVSGRQDRTFRIHGKCGWNLGNGWAWHWHT